MDIDMAYFKLELSTDIESVTFRNTLQEAA
jgi:hypothetical protein